MAYKRRTSQIMVDAQQRIANLKAIDPALDLGNGLTVAFFDAQIMEMRTALEAYNSLLAQADAAGNTVNAIEKNISALSTRMLAGVGVKYGKDSSEYEMAGGTRTSEIIRKTRAKKPAA